MQRQLRPEIDAAVRYDFWIQTLINCTLSTIDRVQVLYEDKKYLNLV